MPFLLDVFMGHRRCRLHDMTLRDNARGQAAGVLGAGVAAAESFSYGCRPRRTQTPIFEQESKTGVHPTDSRAPIVEK
jgi:hypothetical protein